MGAGAAVIAELKENVVDIGKLGKALGIGLKILPHLGTAMEVIEKLKGDAPGEEKENAAVEAVKTSLELIEGVAEADLLDDPKVEKAVRDVIKAVKSLTNVVRDVIDKRRQAASGR